MNLKSPVPVWTFAVPIAASLLFFGNSFVGASWYSFLLAFALIGAVMTAVHHADVLAHRVGEPFGTLILAIAITVIEVSLVVSLMLAGGPETSELARDTVFAAVMILLTGIIGLCLLFVSLFSGLTVTPGIDTKSTVPLLLSLFTVMLSFGAGRTTILQGAVLLVIFAVYLL
jgi:Ca2+/H+ antiporter